MNQPLRWRATTSYSDKRSPTDVTFDELGYLHEIVDKNPYRQAIKEIVVRMNESFAKMNPREFQVLPGRKSCDWRWKGTIWYLDRRPPDVFWFDELDQLHDIIERGRDWHEIDRIVIRLNGQPGCELDRPRRSRVIEGS